MNTNVENKNHLSSKTGGAEPLEEKDSSKMYWGGLLDPRAKEDYCVKHWWRFQRPIVAVLQAEACFLKQGNQKREENNDVSDQTLIEAVSTM